MIINLLLMFCHKNS